ncbi:MAG: hypothetical protein ACFFDH_14050 [Promethearchaeota archaeon]
MENNTPKSLKAKIKSFFLKLTERQIFLTFIIGLLIIGIGAIGFILNFIIRINVSFILLYFNIIGPLICLIGIIILLSGIVLMNIGFFIQDKFQDNQKGILMVLDSYAIAILLFIISIFVPHVYREFEAEGFLRYILGGWEGIILLLIAMFLYYNDEDRKAILVGVLANLSMYIFLFIDLMSSYSLKELGPGFYLYIVSFIIVFSINLWRNIVWQISKRKTQN